MDNTDLAFLIMKNHRGEWLPAKRVNAVICAIKGVKTPVAKTTTLLNRLKRAGKIASKEDNRGVFYSYEPTLNQ